MNRTTTSRPSASARAPTLPASVLPAILAGLCGLGLLTPAQAVDVLPAALPPVIAPLWYGSSVDMGAGTYAALAGRAPLGTQAVVTAVEIPGTGKMATVWPQDATYTGPRDSGGWGIVEGRGSYTLGLDKVLSFDVPLTLLHAADGVFAYGFETYQYGGWGGVDYFGVSGKDYLIGCVPEPAAPLSMGAGLLALGAFAWRRAPARVRA